MDASTARRHSCRVTLAPIRRAITGLVRERGLRLPGARTGDPLVQRDLPVPMPDGVVLLADRYTARGTRPGGPAGAGVPTVLVRTPYGRNGRWALMYGPSLADRGFQVIIQSVRGTGGSGGRLVPRLQERDDGLATVGWIREQPWFGGTLAGSGFSYLGYALWAIADDGGLDAVCLQATMPSLAEPMFDGGSFALGLALPWTAMISRTGRRFQRVRDRLGNRLQAKMLRAGLDRLPLADGDLTATGRHIDFYQDWLSHHPDDEYWTAQAHTARVRSLTVPVSMRTGWYDVYLPWLLRDHAALCAAGNPPRLTIGPWGHVSPGMQDGIPGETADFLSEHLLGSPPPPGRRVRFHVTGAGEWRDADTWPPPGGRDDEWVLRPGGGLVPLEVAGAGLADREPAESKPAEVEPAEVERAPAGAASVFRYDPADPTPALGGPSMLADETSVDNRPLEQRADVLSFTSLPLPSDLDVIGTPRARLRVSADNPHHDVFVRLDEPQRAAAPARRRPTRTRRHPGGFAGAVADGAPLRRRSPDQGPGQRRRAPPLRAEPGHRRTPRHGHPDRAEHHPRASRRRRPARVRRHPAGRGAAPGFCRAGSMIAAGMAEMRWVP
jgi:putative CocE/NonD family hydrolase